MKKILIFIVLLAFVAPLNSNAQEENKPLRILFVGNSFTFFWNMPQMVQAMGDHQDFPLVVRQSTVSGSNLKEHWKGEKGTHTKQLIEEGNWDYVVLGDHSLSTIETPKRFQKYGKKFSELIRAKGAEPVFLITWAYDSNPLMQASITQGYLDLAHELDAKVIPAGPVLMKARELRPELDYYFDDKHPSSDASYLIALTAFKALTNKTVSEIPARVITTDKDGEKLYLSFVLPKRASFFKQLVDETDFDLLSK